MFDIFTAKKIKVFDSQNWEEVIKTCQTLLYVPSWFSGKQFKYLTFFYVYFSRFKMWIFANNSVRRRLLWWDY